jgi:hypothetical protein
LKVIVLSLIAAFLFSLSSCDRSSIGQDWSGSNNGVSYSWSGENKKPIPAVYGLNEKDISNVYFSGSQYREGRFSFEWQEQYTWLINSLRKLELLEKAEGYDKGSAQNCLCYEIEVRNASPIVLNFYDNIIEFGEGCFYYTDADKSTVPKEIISISVSNPETSSSVCYDDPADIEELRSVLAISAADGTFAYGEDNYNELMNIYFNDWVTENISLYARMENGSYYIFKEFFATYICMGEINQQSYDSLLLAGKNQFGTHEHFSVTSGETTIHPLGHFMYGTQYDEQTGQGLAADGFPQLSEWVDKLESVRYEPDFTLWFKDERATLCISIAETQTDMTYQDIEALPPGEYTMACRITTLGDYVEKANNYNSSTSVFWFKLLKP